MLCPHGRDRCQQKAKALFESLVPNSGRADRIQGEPIRRSARLGSEIYRNGNGNWDRGFVMMAHFLAKHLCDGSFDPEITARIERDVALVIVAGKCSDNGAYAHGQEDSYTRLTDRVVEWCDLHPEPISHEANPRLKR